METAVIRTDVEFMSEAIRLAEENVRTNGGGPFGAVVVRNGEILASGCNEVTSSHDPTAHAEVVAIRKACAALGDFQLEGCVVYASCEPCPMCLGAIYWCRCERVVFAARAADAAASGFDDSLIYREAALPWNERSRHFEFLEHPDRLAPFRAWDRSAGKVPY